jgi:creatinine amidohydrolase
MVMADHIVVSEMTWTEVDEVMKSRPVAIVPVGATVAHGPHLPLNTDSIIATEMARRGAVKLKERGVTCLVLPPVAFTVADMGGDFAGSLSMPSATAIALLRDVAVVATKKFRAVVFANIHLEPAHVECVKKAVDEAKKAGASCCMTDILKKRWTDLIGQDIPTDEHAGAFDTSLMLAVAPERVRDVRRSLPPVDGMQEAFKKGAKTYADAGGEDAYFGDPTAASAEDGDTYFEGLAEILAVSVLEHLGSGSKA